jgi:hypothetical protein
VLVRKAAENKLKFENIRLIIANNSNLYCNYIMRQPITLINTGEETSLVECFKGNKSI